MATPYEEIDEDRIRSQLEMIQEAGESTDGLDKLLMLGQIYKDHGMTPMYLLDDMTGRFRIAIKETQDKSKLH